MLRVKAETRGTFYIIFFLFGCNKELIVYFWFYDLQPVNYMLTRALPKPKTTPAIGKRFYHKPRIGAKTKFNNY